MPATATTTKMLQMLEGMQEEQSADQEQQRWDQETPQEQQRHDQKDIQ